MFDGLDFSKMGDVLADLQKKGARATNADRKSRI